MIIDSLTLELHDFNREVLLSHKEDLQIAKDGFLGLRVTIDFDT